MASEKAVMYKAAALTHVGCVRARNEDNILLRQDPDAQCLLAVVADGMGGHLGGAIASALAVAQFDDIWHVKKGEPDFVESLLDEAWISGIVRQVHTVIRLRSEQEPELKNMGTTMVVLAMCGARACIAHVGDSRAYRFCGGVLEQVTRDHSLVQKMVDDGALTEAEAEKSPLRNYLTRSVGGGDQNGQPDSIHLELAAGDRLLLCSDGLSNMLSHKDIASVLADIPDDEIACQTLLDMALERGAHDNVSLILCTA